MPDEANYIVNTEEKLACIFDSPDCYYHLMRTLEKTLNSSIKSACASEKPLK